LVTAASVQAREYSSVDITSHHFWDQPFAVRDESFARLRAGEALTWHRPMPSMFPTEEPGFWALTRRADIAFVSQHPESFTSAQGVALDPMPAEIQRIASFFLTMDPPQHTVYRRPNVMPFCGRLPLSLYRLMKKCHGARGSSVT
jgi:cytochrome P450